MCDLLSAQAGVLEHNPRGRRVRGCSGGRARPGRRRWTWPPP
ncbi:hypothetical protein [Streptomyces sp. NPDC088707]